MKKTYVKPINLFVIITLLYISFISIIGQLHGGVNWGDDLVYHLARIEGITNAIKLNQLPAYIHSNILNGYGYGSGFFYPNFLLYIPSIFRLIGISVNTSYKIFLLIINILTSLSIYLSTKYITKNKYSSLLASILFVLCQYRIVNIYVRSAVGEFCAMTFIPIVICGLYDLLHNDFKKPWILSLGFLGLILTHTITLFIGIIIAIIAVIINIKTFITNLKLIYKLFLTALCTILISSFYWMPFLEQCMADAFSFSIQRALLSYYMVSIYKFFLDIRWISVGIPLIIICFLRFFVPKEVSSKNRELIKILDLYLIAGIILCLLCTTLIPWKSFEHTIINNIQFPWRLLSFASCFLSISSALLLNFTFKESYKAPLFMFILLITTAFSSIIMIPSVLNLVNYKFNKQSSFWIGNGEWLPLGTDKDKLFDTKPCVLDENNNSIDFNKNGYTVTFNNKNCPESNYYTIPLLYYKGYCATITTNNGTKELRIEKGDNNLVKVINNDKFVGNVTVTYSNTIMQKLSILISLISLVTIDIIYLIFKYKKVKSIDNNHNK